MALLESALGAQNQFVRLCLGNGGNENGLDRRRQSSKCQHKILRHQTPLSTLLDAARDPVGVLGEAARTWYDGTTIEQRQRKAAWEARRQFLLHRQQTAMSYREWESASMELDELEDHNAWKRDFNSPDYYPEELEQHLRQLDDARARSDVRRMLFLVRTSLSRNLAQMGNLKLYQYSHIGTKDLIERYINSALAVLRALVELSSRPPSPLLCNGNDETPLGPMEIYNEILAARQSFGRSALLLSGGATFGMNHNGVLKALWEAQLLPRIISGASAGSIVSAVVCTKTDSEIPDLMDTFCTGDLAVFEPEGSDESWMRKLARLLKHGSMFDIAHLTRVMKNLLGDLTFMEAYYRTRRILNICVSSAGMYELPRLLNFVTAPNVVIWSAVAASCSVPLIFSSASLLVKDPKTQEITPWAQSPQKWIDGSVDNDLPMQRLSEMFNVNHFIVSQVNPHVVPFLSKDEDISSTNSSSSIAPGPSWLSGITTFAKSEAVYRMSTLADLGIFPNALTKAVSVLSQKYSGDITILPEIPFREFPSMLSNPTERFMSDAMLRGARATWPKLSRVRNHCAIELALDNAAHELRARTVFGAPAYQPSIETLRRVSVQRAKSDYGKVEEEAGEQNLVMAPVSIPKAHAPQSRARRRRKSQSSAPDRPIFEFSRQARSDHRRRHAQSPASALKTRNSRISTSAMVNGSEMTASSRSHHQHLSRSPHRIRAQPHHLHGRPNGHVYSATSHDSASGPGHRDFYGIRPGAGMDMSGLEVGNHTPSAPTSRHHSPIHSPSRHPSPLNSPSQPPATIFTASAPSSPRLTRALHGLPLRRASPSTSRRNSRDDPPSSVRKYHGRRVVP